MAIETKILTFGGSKVGTVGENKLMGYTEPPIPLQVTDIRLWLNNDLSTMTVNGSNKVSQWRDSSGNLNHFSQGTGANQPLFVANGINGQNGVKWANGVTEFLDCTLTNTINQPNTMFFVWNIDASSTNLYPCLYDRANVAHDRVVCYWFSNQLYFASDTTVNVYTKNRPFNLINTQVVNNATNSKIYENGTLKNTINLGNKPITSLRLGHTGVLDSTTRLSGYICEVIVYAKELSAGERTLINDYLTLKYGL